MAEFKNPAEHISATNAVILQAREALRLLRGLQPHLEWVNKNYKAATAPATPEQIEHHKREMEKKVWGDMPKDLPPVASAIRRLLREQGLPKYANEQLSAEFGQRASNIGSISRRLSDCFDSLESLAGKINAGATLDFLPLHTFWEDPDNLLDAYPQAIACVTEAMNKATQEKQSVLNKQSAAVGPGTARMKSWERKAYLSYVEALQEKPHLGNATMRAVYDWIRENGVSVDGEKYDLPDFATWRKYRRAGERHAKPA